MPKRRYTIAVDFDGVIHSHTSPWKNARTIPDPPVEGAIRWLIAMVQKFRVVVYSTRCRTWLGRRAVRRWLKREAGYAWWESPAGFRGLEEVELSFEKPTALAYLDDRAIRFEGPGTFPSADEIRQMRPWNKR